MLPHTKRTPGIGKALNGLGVIVPICFMVLYYFKFGKNDGCNNMLDANFTYNNATKTTIYNKYRLKIMGTGFRDGVIMIIGYFVEMVLLGIMYNLLYNVILIH